MTKENIKIKYTRPYGDDENENILYADIFKEGKEICNLVLCPELYPDGWDMKWTGNAELAFRDEYSDDFDIITTGTGLRKGEDNKKLAKELIESNVDLAIRIHEANVEGEML